MRPRPQFRPRVLPGCQRTREVIENGAACGYDHVVGALWREGLIIRWHQRPDRNFFVKDDKYLSAPGASPKPGPPVLLDAPKEPAILRASSRFLAAENLISAIGEKRPQQEELVQMGKGTKSSHPMWRMR